MTVSAPVLAAALAAACALARAQTSTSGAAAAARLGHASQTGNAESPAIVAPVLIHAPRRFNHRPRYAHSRPEISGTQLTLTRKIAVVELGSLPPIVNHPPRPLFDPVPGLVLAEQDNPLHLNLSYRGLGNPPGCEYVPVMQDVVPMETDWIGVPTLQYLANVQSIEKVGMIRGGSGLLDGAGPEPVMDVISRRPAAGHISRAFSIGRRAVSA